MKEKGSIINLQKELLPNWGASKCLLSELSIFESQQISSPLSVKMVLSGNEEYRINGSGFKLEGHQYLIVNQGDALETSVQHKPIAKGICIYPPESLVTEVSSKINLSLADQLELDKSHSRSIRFTSKLSHISKDGLAAAYLSEKVQALMASTVKTSVWWEEFYSELVIRLIKDQLKLEDKLKQLPSSKKKTKEELYRRLALAKDYIHDHRFETIDIELLSQASALSKFHFLRNFKALYGCSPYQLSLKLKLEEAMTLIQKNYTYQQASEIVGYSDSKNLRKALLKVM